MLGCRRGRTFCAPLGTAARACGTRGRRRGFGIRAAEARLLKRPRPSVKRVASQNVFFGLPPTQELSPRSEARALHASSHRGFARGPGGQRSRDACGVLSEPRWQAGQRLCTEPQSPTSQLKITVPELALCSFKTWFPSGSEGLSGSIAATTAAPPASRLQLSQDQQCHTRSISLSVLWQPGSGGRSTGQGEGCSSCLCSLLPVISISWSISDSLGRSVPHHRSRCVVNSLHAWTGAAAGIMV